MDDITETIRLKNNVINGQTFNDAKSLKSLLIFIALHRYQNFT